MTKNSTMRGDKYVFRKCILSINKMAEHDKSPLLKFDQLDDYETQRQQIRHLYENNERSSGGDGSNDVITISGSTSASVLAEPDNVVAIFVVAFDTRTGGQY